MRCLAADRHQECFGNVSVRVDVLDVVIVFERLGSPGKCAAATSFVSGTVFSGRYVSLTETGSRPARLRESPTESSWSCGVMIKWCSSPGGDIVRSFVERASGDASLAGGVNWDS